MARKSSVKRYYRCLKVFVNIEFSTLSIDTQCESAHHCTAQYFIKLLTVIIRGDNTLVECADTVLSVLSLDEKYDGDRQKLYVSSQYLPRRKHLLNIKARQRKLITSKVSQLHVHIHIHHAQTPAGAYTHKHTHIHTRIH